MFIFIPFYVASSEINEAYMLFVNIEQKKL